MTDCSKFETEAHVTLLGAAISYFKTRAKQRQDRAAFQHLLGLEPHILKDIGVNLGDVIWANSLPVEVNAAKALERETRHRKMCV